MGLAVVADEIDQCSGRVGATAGGLGDLERCAPRVRPTRLSRTHLFFITVSSVTKSGEVRGGATLLAAPCRRASEERAYRIRLRDTQRATIGSDRILEPHVDRKRGTSRFSVTPNSQQARPTDRAIVNAQLMLGLIGLPFTLGSRPAGSPHGTFRRGSFVDFVAARTEILRVR
jgi:hypothetical protein